MRVPSAPDQVGHGDAVGRHRLLRQHAQPGREDARGQPGDGGAVEQDGARRGPQQPGQPAQQRRLAARVGPDDRRDPGRGDPHAETVDDAAIAVGQRQVLCPESPWVGSPVAGSGHPVAPIRLARISSAISTGAPTSAVITRRPLGLPREIPADRLRVVLEFAPSAPTIGAAKRVRGLRLVAIAGRRGVVGELGGAGQPTIARRIGAQA